MIFLSCLPSPRCKLHWCLTSLDIRRKIRKQSGMGGGRNQTGLSQLHIWKLWRPAWGQLGGVCIPMRKGWVHEAITHMARDEDLIQAVLLSVSIAYSRFGHTMPYYSGINANSEKQSSWCIRSLPAKHWRGDIRVKGDPHVLHVCNEGIWWFNCWGRLVGPISPFRPWRRKERREGWLISREHHFHVISKKESRITESGRRILYA